MASSPGSCSTCSGSEAPGLLAAPSAGGASSAASTAHSCSPPACCTRTHQAPACVRGRKGGRERQGEGDQARGPKHRAQYACERGGPLASVRERGHSAAPVQRVCALTSSTRTRAPRCSKNSSCRVPGAASASPPASPGPPRSALPCRSASGAGAGAGVGGGTRLRAVPVAAAGGTSAASAASSVRSTPSRPNSLTRPSAVPTWGAEGGWGGRGQCPGGGGGWLVPRAGQRRACILAPPAPQKSAAAARAFHVPAQPVLTARRRCVGSYAHWSAQTGTPWAACSAARHDDDSAAGFSRLGGSGSPSRSLAHANSFIAAIAGPCTGELAQTPHGTGAASK